MNKMTFIVNNSGNLVQNLSNFEIASKKLDNSQI